ncbi:MAG: tetratricopeptide repeat protein [Chloroflexi bacterium]|nr:tetratricopeptide repeat protein [Chloroflexota bacterium]
MPTELSVFISSKMQELAPERKALQELLPTLGRDIFKFQTWIFEGDAPASNKSIRDIYLEALQNADLYIGIFWNEFGEWTLDEFERATERGIERHLYVKNLNPEQRDPRLQAFLDKQSDVRFGITPRWFTSLEDLKQQVGRSVEKWLLERQVAYHSAISAVFAQIPDDVPEQPKRLVGRDDLVAEVQALLDDQEHILLRGFGGMGKTALAATIAAQHTATGRGPVLWLRVGAAEPDAVFEAVGRALGMQQAIATTSGDERLQVIRHLLAETKALLVLDDVWNGAALARVVKAVPRAMPLLVTSRHRFPLDEIIEVGELKPAEALKLLNLYVRGRDISSDLDARRLCEILGYHAFALEIASKTLKVYQLSPAELLQRVEQAPHDLSMPANYGEMGRAGVKSLLDTSVSALHRDLLDVFIALGGMFEPSSTPELLARVMGRNTQTVGDALSQLEERGLVSARKHHHVEYFRLHDLAYSYARTMFMNKGRSHLPVVEACQMYASAHKDDLDALDVEQSNILEAAETAYHSNQADVFIAILKSLTVDGPYFAARGHTAVSLKLLKNAIQAARESNELETAHYLLSRLGNSYADFMGDYDNALMAYQEALALARSLGNVRREAILLTVIGKMRLLQNADDANDYYGEAETIARNLSDDFVLGFVLHHQGYQFINQQPPDYERGKELSDEAAKIAAALRLPDIHFWSLLNRGSCEHELGELSQALATHYEAYELAKEQNNHFWLAGVLRSIGEDYHRMDNRVQAQAAFDEALALWREVKAKAQADDLIQYMNERAYTVQPEL